MSSLREAIDALKAWPVQDLAERLGLTGGRGGGIRPCPKCGAERRGRSDPRGPVGATADGAGWRCHRCDASGSSLDLLSWVELGARYSAEHRQAILEATARYGLTVERPPAPRSEPKPRPDDRELRRLWFGAAAVTDDETAAAWLRSRGLDPAAIADLDLARVIGPEAALPRWARAHGRSWAATGHRLILALYGPGGRMESVRARAIGDADRKTLAPTGFRVAGLIYADATARRMLEGVRPDGWDGRIVAVEGEPDYLTWGTRFGDAEETPAIIGVDSGAWTSELAALIPDGATVIVRTDHDDSGQRYAREIIDSLTGRCSILRSRPEPHPDPAKARKGKTADENDRLQAGTLPTDPADGCDPVEAEPTDQRPEIQVTADLGGVVDAALEALRTDPNLYQRRGALVRIVRDGARELSWLQRATEAPMIRTADKDAIVGRLDRCARFVTVRKDGPKPVHPPEIIARQILARDTWPFPPLEAVVEVPTMRPDGSLLTAPGYDRATGLLYEPLPRASYPPMPDRPTRDDAHRAGAELLEPFDDFVFADATNDRAALLGAILATVGRNAIDGCVPMWAVRANQRGSGKTLLASCIARIATGRRPDVMIHTRKEDEEKKRLFALALEAPRIVILDNVVGELGSPALAAVLTGGRLRDRVLGLTETETADIRSVWVATGNGIAFKDDLPRRVIPIDIHTDSDEPELRTGFEHGDLEAHVAKRAPALLTAALTMLRAYHVAGRPEHGAARWGGFYAFDDVVRGAVIWSGHGDPLATRARIREDSDSDADNRRAVLLAWFDAFGAAEQTVAAAIRTADGDEHLRVALLAVARGRSSGSDRIDPIRLGNYLRANRDTPTRVGADHARLPGDALICMRRSDTRRKDGWRWSVAELV